MGVAEGLKASPASCVLQHLRTHFHVIPALVIYKNVHKHTQAVYDLLEHALQYNRIMNVERDAPSTVPAKVEVSEEPTAAAESAVSCLKVEEKNSTKSSATSSKSEGTKVSFELPSGSDGEGDERL